jgi:hypothetical protein
MLRKLIVAIGLILGVLTAVDDGAAQRTSPPNAATPSRQTEAQRLGGSVDQTESFSVRDPRPLSEAVRVVAKRCGCAITYEDPRYDVSDAVELPRLVGKGPRKLIPRGGSFTFTIDVPQGVQEPTVIAGLLRRILAAYHTSGNPGAFHMEQTNEMFHVVPENSILQRRVSVRASPSGGETAEEAILAVLQGVRTANGAEILVGGIAMNLTSRTYVFVGARDVPAQEVLAGIFTATKKGFSWRLFYDIDLQKYFLNY